MKVEGQRPLNGPYSARRVASGATNGTARTGSVAGTAPPRAASDTTQILGIPDAEFTPRVRDAIMRLMQEVERLRQELDQTKRRLDASLAEADQDPLLPVLNRRAFVREMSRITAFAERYSMPASMIYIDLNGFKAINDGHGHAAGDAALTHIAEILTGNVRDSDAVGRLGGDEFGVILAKGDAAIAQTKAAALLHALELKPFRWKGQALPLSFSYGVYEFRQGQDAHQAIAEADEAMYKQKRKDAEKSPAPTKPSPR